MTLWVAVNAPAAYGDDVSPSPVDPDDVTIEQIVAAWNARHDRVQSLHFEFTQDMVLVRQDELRLHCDELVVIDGDRYFREMVGQRWNLNLKGPVDETLIQLYDGERSLNFYGRAEQSDRLHSIGKIRVIGHDTYFAAGFSDSLFPIFHTYRIRQPWFLDSTADAWILTPRQGQIDGRRCVIVENRREADAGHTFELWVDTTRDYIALRKVMGAEDRIVSQLDIEYEEDAIAGWAPRRWVHNLYSSSAANRLQETCVFEVISSEFNQPVSEEYFEFEFPVGTVVYDETQGGRSFLVGEDGNREITEEERLRGSRYTDWLSTDSGEALLPPKPFPIWRWVVITFALCILGWYLAVARKRVRSVALLAAFAVALQSGGATSCADDGTSSPDASASVDPDDVTIEQIVAAWHARQDLVQSLHFEITGSKVMPQSNLGAVLENREVFIEGWRYRVARRGDTLHPQLGLIKNEDLVVLYDGTDATFFFGVSERNDRLHPHASIGSADHENYFSEAHNGAVSPIFFAYRIGQHGFLSDSVDGWRLSGHQGVVDGRKCSIVQWTGEPVSGTRRYEIWVDPSRDFIVLRKFRTRSDGQPFVQLDIEYAGDSRVGWVPTRWVDNIYGLDGDGNAVLSDATSYEVNAYEFNQPVDESVFTMTFPVGTEVYDHDEIYIVTENGKRIVTDEERNRGARYTDLMATDSGEALLPPQPFPMWRWTVIAVATGVVGWYVVKGRQRSRSA